MNFRIDRLQRRLTSDPDGIPLAGGLPAEATFPKASLGRAMVRALSGSAAALQYGWPEGRESLRGWIARRLAARGASVSADQVIVCSGAQQAIAIATQLVVEQGQRIAVAQETYPAALDLFRTRGLDVTTAIEGARAVYATPAISNPAGTALGPEARLALLDAASGGVVAILEDDAYADLSFAGPPPAPLLARDRDHTWHIGTFSKTLCPGLRVGWLIPPSHRYEDALCVKQALDLQANSLAQAIIEAFLEGEDFDARVVRLRRFYRRRADRLAEAVRRHLPGWRFTFPEGGFALWLESDEPGCDSDLLACAVRRGTSFDPGSEFRADAAEAPIAMRLSFSSAAAERFDEGVSRLAAAWDDYRASWKTREERTSSGSYPVHPLPSSVDHGRVSSS